MGLMVIIENVALKFGADALDWWNNHPNPSDALGLGIFLFIFIAIFPIPLFWFDMHQKNSPIKNAQGYFFLCVGLEIWSILILTRPLAGWVVHKYSQNPTVAVYIIGSVFMPTLIFAGLLFSLYVGTKIIKSQKREETKNDLSKMQ